MKSAANFIQHYQNISITENGAIGYRTTTHELADLNFMVSSLRSQAEEYIEKQFIKAYYESPKYAVKWLFFLRDILEGMGERRTFRICMKYLAESHTEIARAVLPLIPEYGRYDDMLIFLYTPLEADTIRFLKEQLDQDIHAMKDNQPVSLLAKWLPGINTSSKSARRMAKRLANSWEMSASEYRKILSALRSYGNVLEVTLSAGRWNEVDYEAVPSKANIKYDNAFLRHDQERRVAYYKQVIQGESRLHSKTVMPYELVHKIMKRGVFDCTVKDNVLVELMWQQLVKQGFENEWGLDDCIVVADGSGSMYSCAAGSTNIRAIEICNALAIYFAEQLNGVFHNKAITFSESPQFIDLDKGSSLKEKLEILLSHGEVANTNIEAVFDLLLHMAVSNEVPAEELPKQVLIISDMEFDSARSRGSYSSRLFDIIEKRYQDAGYIMPRLIFWNVCRRTNTIPKVDNEEGLCLLSGFSQNAMKITADKTVKDPYKSLLQVLDGERYDPVEEKLAGLVA